MLNPVRAGMVTNLGEYPWSSFNATAGAAIVPELLSTDWILKQFGDHRESAQAEYRRFILAGIREESPWKELKGQVLMGGKKVLEKLIPYLKQKSALKEIRLSIGICIARIK